MTLISHDGYTIVAAISIAVAGLVAHAGDFEPQPGELPPQAYEVTVLPNIPDHPFSRTTGLNEAGEAVGGNWPCPFILSCLGKAFHYDGEAVHDFTLDLVESLPPGQLGSTAAFDINDSNDILFRLTIIDVGVFPYLWRDGEEYIEIAAPPEAFAITAWSINDVGQVVGTYSTDAGGRGYIWTADNGFTDIIDPPKGYTSSSAMGINSAGDTVGTLGASGSSLVGYHWSNGEFTVLDPLPGDVRAEAVVINDNGLIAGTSQNADFDDRLVLWQDGEVVDSVTLPFDDVMITVNDINNDGMVVGSYWPFDVSAQPIAFRWTSTGGFEDIDSLDQSIPGLTMWEATGVNDAGQILAWGEFPGFEPGSFLLTPEISVPGDLNNDGAVNTRDLLMLLAAWGPCDPPGDCPADLDQSGTVGTGDLLILLENWG